MAEDTEGRIWMAGDSGSIIRYDPESSELLYVSDTVGESRNIAMLFDKKGYLWVGSRDSGIQRIDPRTGIRHRITVEQGLVSDQIYALMEDSNGMIWTSGGRGVERLDLDNMEVSLFTRTQGLGANDVYDIEEHNGKIYAGTSRGISVLTNESAEQDLWDVFNSGTDQGMLEFDIS